MISRISGWSVFFVALIVRLIYHLFDVIDFWGDSYHNIHMVWMSVQNDFVYSDYKGRHLVWLPFYRYLSGALMYTFDSYTLQVGHYLNMILGSLTCVAVYVVGRLISNARSAIIGSLILAILPWHVAYSHMNMPEVVTALLIISTIYFQLRGNIVAAIFCAFLGALTRYEVTVLLGIYGVLDFFVNKKNPYPILLGLAMGLFAWSMWSLYNTGNFFFWIEARAAGSTWDANFYELRGSVNKNLINPLASLIQVFPFVLIFILFHKKLWNEMSGKIRPLFFLLIVHWLLVFITQFYATSFPDPRYFLITVPLGALCMGHLWSSEDRKVFIWMSIAVLIVSTLQFAQFPYRTYKYKNFLDTATFLKSANMDKGNLWCDFPVVEYFSAVDMETIRTSEMILRSEDRETDNREDRVIQRMEEEGVTYVVSHSSSYSIVMDVWPQMWGGVEFSSMGMNFKPIFETVKFKAISDRWSDKLKESLEPNEDGVIRVWEVQRSSNTSSVKSQ